MKKLLVFLVCAICAFMLFACGDKSGGEGGNGGNNTPQENVELDKSLDAKYKGLAKDKKLYLTTIGQADIDKVDSLLEDLDMEAGKDYTKKNELTAAEVEEGAVVFVVIGTSGKGLGAAGTDLNGEKKRANDFIAKEGITLVVFHVGGIERRGDTTDPIIDIVCPKAKLLLVVNGANDDNKFTNIAKNNSIDLYLFSKTAKMFAAVKTLLDK